MPDMTCVKTGSLDKVAVEFYASYPAVCSENVLTCQTKDRTPYCTAVSGADQKSAF